MTPPLVIIGAPRSFTSFVAQVCVAHGVWCGPSRKADAGNPAGYFENVELAGLRMGKLNRSTIAELLKDQGYRGGPWLVKHTPVNAERWAVLSPVYLKVWRDPLEVVLSLARRRSNLGQHPKSAERDYANTLRHQKSMQQFGGFEIEVDPRDWFGFKEPLAAIGVTFEPKLAAKMWRGDLAHLEMAA